MADTVNIIPQTSPWSLMQQNPDPQGYDEIQTKMNQFAANNQQLQQNQAMANLGMQKTLTEAETPVDLSSVMALADSWAGPNSKLAANYKNPETALQRRQMLASLQAELDKSQEGMSQNQIALLKAQLETAARKEDRELQLEMLKETKAQTKAMKDQALSDKEREQRRKALADAQDKWVKDPISVEATKKYYEVDGVRKAIGEAADNPALKGILPALIARLNEKGVLTDQDIARYSGDQSFAAKWKQYLQSAEEGTITPENLALFEKVANRFAETAENTMHERASLHAKQYAKQIGISEDQALADITGNTISPEILKPKKAQSTKPAPRTQVGQQFKTKEGKVVEFMGGDENNPKNYKEVQ